MIPRIDIYAGDVLVATHDNEDTEILHSLAKDALAAGLTYRFVSYPNIDPPEPDYQAEIEAENGWLTAAEHDDEARSEMEWQDAAGLT